jgi:hypothetical protein
VWSPLISSRRSVPIFLLSFPTHPHLLFLMFALHTLLLHATSSFLQAPSLSHYDTSPAKPPNMPLLLLLLILASFHSSLRLMAHLVLLHPPLFVLYLVFLVILSLPLFHLLLLQHLCPSSYKSVMLISWLKAPCGALQDINTFILFGLLTVFSFCVGGVSLCVVVVGVIVRCSFACCCCWCLLL